MPIPPFVQMPTPRVRKDPLGPVTLNQLQRNAESVDELLRAEHFNDGAHNALEVPWLLGRINDGSPPTGALFDSAYGGSTFTRPATGEYTMDVASGVVPADSSSRLLYSAMANVFDNAIESKPHTVTVEATSATSFKFRVRGLSSAIGAGDTWADVNRSFCVGLHAPAQDADQTALTSHLEKVRADFLTDEATDWNALVENQGILRAAALLEHNSTGAHSVTRIAKAIGWFTWDGSSYAAESNSVRISSVTQISAGVVEVTTSDTFFLASVMACFPEAQPSTPDELVIINGKPYNATKFRFYIYAFDGTNWARADRTFSAALFGVLA